MSETHNHSDESLVAITRRQSLDVNRASIKQAFRLEQLGVPATPDFEAVMVSRPWQLRWYSKFATVACLSVLLGVLGGYWLGRPSPATWQMQAASYHALYGPETLAAVNTDRKVAAEELDRVGAAIGKPLLFNKFSTVSGLHFKRAQVLRFGVKPLAQIAFVTKRGHPIALCIMPDGAPIQGLEGKVMAGVNTVGWSVSNFSFLVIGGNDQRELQEFAIALQQAVGT
jgi:hypothetical protein